MDYLEFCRVEAFRQMTMKHDQIRKLFRSLPSTVSKDTLERIVRRLSRDYDPAWKFQYMARFMEQRERHIEREVFAIEKMD